jgi:uncharacterized protein (DUF1330 family)
VTLCVLLTATAGNAAGLAEYEDTVLALLPAHGARVRERLRVVDRGDGPHEVHVLEFPSEAALDAYLADPARVALSERRDAAIAATELLRVEVVPPRGPG